MLFAPFKEIRNLKNKFI